MGSHLRAVVLRGMLRELRVRQFGVVRRRHVVIAVQVSEGGGVHQRGAAVRAPVGATQQVRVAQQLQRVQTENVCAQV